MQNSYSSIAREDCDPSLAEICHCHDDSLFPCSSLAGGVLSIKCSDPKVYVVPNARLKIFPALMGRHLGSRSKADALELARRAQGETDTSHVSYFFCLAMLKVSSLTLSQLTLK